MAKKAERIKEKKKRPPIPKYYYVIYAVLISIFVFSAYKLIDYYYNNYKSEHILDNLKEEKDKTDKITDDMLAPKLPGQNSNVSTTTQDLLSPTELLPEKASEGDILDSYKKLYELNHDLCGWIAIDNTSINYPVLYRKDDNTTYLHTDYEGHRGSRAGSIFIDGHSHYLEEDPSANLILYGHNMQVGTMFHDLMNYKKESYYLSHPVIKFDTLYETATYAIIATFSYDVEPGDMVSDFAYYNYYHITTEKKYDEYVTSVKKASLYDTGISASFGDQLITLSTCADYEQDTTKRFVVVAKKL